MATEREYQLLQDLAAALQAEATERLGPELLEHPELGDLLAERIDDLVGRVGEADRASPPPPDAGLAELVGIGAGAAPHLGATRVPSGVEAYDDQVASERIVAIGDLYYVYQHEKLGVFRAVKTLQRLFQAGDVRLSGGQGAYALYRWDRRGVLRYTARDRLAAYCRAFGYCKVPAPPGARPNREFHPLFTHFIQAVTLFWRDKRISQVIRQRAQDPSFGSIAEVRRSGLDLRNNLKLTSYGHLNVLRIEVMQLLDEAFRILDSDDVKRLFGAENAWDVIEEVLQRYLHEELATSARQRMAVAGREVLRWLGQPHIRETNRAKFEARLLSIAEYAEEWLSSAESVGAAERVGQRRRLTWAPPPAVAAAGARRDGRAVPDLRRT
jgi:hypothetical protein